MNGTWSDALKRYSQAGRWILLFLACAFQVSRTATFFAYTNSDRNLQTQLSRNWLHGHGLSILQVDATDLSQVHYLPAPQWPPGYNVLQAGLYLLTGDWFLSIEFLHFLALIALFAAMSGLWSLLRTPKTSWGEAFFWLGWAISFAPFQYLGTTDLLSLACLMLALFALGKHHFRSALKWELLAMLALAAGAWFRWAFYPFLLLPLWLALPSWQHLRQWRSWKSMLKRLGLTLLLNLPLWLWQAQASQGRAYFGLRAYVATDQSWFPEHLLRMDGFVLKAFWYVYPPRLAEMLSLSPLGMRLIWGGAGLLLLLGIGYLWRLGPKALPGFEKRVGLCKKGTLGIFLLTLGPLVGLSLLVPLEDWTEGITWTYVEESRYYAPVMVLLWLWVALGMSGENSRKWLRRSFQLVGLVLLLGSAFHAGSRWVGWGRGETREATGSDFEADLHQTYSLVSEKKQTGELLLWVHGIDYGYADKQMVASWAGAPFLSFSDFLAHPKEMSQPMSIWFHLNEAEWQVLESRSSIARDQLTVLTELAGLPLYEWRGAGREERSLR